MRFRVSVVNNGIMIEKTFDTAQEVAEFFNNRGNFNINTDFSCTERVYDKDGSGQSSIPVASGI